MIVKGITRLVEKNEELEAVLFFVADFTIALM
jgi:hypothetical protein